jgi:hypothetical protein
MNFIPSIIEIYELAKVIADNGHGDKNQLRTWLMAEANRGAFPIHDFANGDGDVLLSSLVEVEQVRPFLIKAMGFDPLVPRSETPQTTETKEQRQDKRLQACIDADLPMDTKKALEQLPRGVGDVAEKLGLTRQAFSTDVKAALKRREAARKEGVK